MITLNLSSEQALQTWFALDEQRKKYQHDLDTRADGHPNFGPEDVQFLTTGIVAITVVQDSMRRQGFQP